MTSRRQICFVIIIMLRLTRRWSRKHALLRHSGAGVLRNRGNLLITRRIKYPSVKPISTSEIKKGPNRVFGLQKRRDELRKCSVAGVAGNGPFIVDYTDWYTMTAEAANNAETLVVATHDNRAHLMLWLEAMALPWSPHAAGSGANHASVREGISQFSSCEPRP